MQKGHCGWGWGGWLYVNLHVKHMYCMSFSIPPSFTESPEYNDIHWWCSLRCPSEGSRMVHEGFSQIICIMQYSWTLYRCLQNASGWQCLNGSPTHSWHTMGCLKGANIFPCAMMRWTNNSGLEWKASKQWRHWRFCWSTGGDLLDVNLHVKHVKLGTRNCKGLRGTRNSAKINKDTCM